MSEPRYEIRGGADPEIAAAIGAVISHLLESEARASASPQRRPTHSRWVLATRPRDAVTEWPVTNGETSGPDEPRDSGIG